VSEWKVQKNRLNRFHHQDPKEKFLRSQARKNMVVVLAQGAQEALRTSGEEEDQRDHALSAASWYH